LRLIPAGKLAGLDKKLSKSLDTEVQVGSSPQELSMSPVGPLSDSARCAALLQLLMVMLLLLLLLLLLRRRHTLLHQIILHLNRPASADPNCCRAPAGNDAWTAWPPLPPPTTVRPPPPARSRKTLIYLILTLNHIYPDYDFSLLRAHHFKKESGLAKAEEVIDTHLLEVSKVI
jgi:hypothetical protein